MKIVLDTCALIWWSLDPEKLSAAAKEGCNLMEKEKNGLVPSIAIWEIAIKIKNKKLDLGVDLNEYVASLKKSTVVRIVPVDEDVWLESVKLEWEHRDPVDRVMVALAKLHQASIITADKEIKTFYSEIIW
ncbi:type II toxin-antitoxin system VapC family toxin [Crocosphaera sp. XPORK-15E]|uniref:type II toxin-antitoxin system VapC family toxin n=1 Tax=Crocosphaera sp. XPORK-15E TaxID=3110247 RepID=UPI002B1FD27C|nr:type II toxin-antitoxin system VapC family toxin [Crocosphaera sp. XPORK-15E]MEA5535222.1 type II toxin-antitoxin system VapC family toxin [Crocosphaera sp. XPORK-15E]